MGGWIDIRPGHIAQPVDELRAVGELELPNPVRLKAMSAPDALDGTWANAGGLRHHRGGPVGRFGGRVRPGERHDTLGNIRIERCNARRPRLIAQEAVVPRPHEAFLPAPHAGLGFAGPAHDRVGADAVHAQQDDLGSPDMLVWCIAIPCERLHAAAIPGLESDGNSSSHAPDAHARRQMGIPLGTPMSDLVH